MILVASANNDLPSSSGVAVSTVIGMVLGVLGLFVLVVSYQFLPRKQKPSSLRALAPPAPKPLPLFERLRNRCTTLLTRRSTPASPLNLEDARTGSHRPLRSFHLTPERRRQREAMRQKFSNSLRLDLSIGLPFKGNLNQEKSSTRKASRSYQPLIDDGDSQTALLKPDTAVISPWSPSEEYLLRTPPPKFSSSPGPSTPPPAYVPTTPLRGNCRGGAIDLPSTPAPMDGSSPSPTNTVLPKAPAADIGTGIQQARSLIEEVQDVIEYTRDLARQSSSNPFVVGDDEGDAQSDTSSDWGTHM